LLDRVPKWVLEELTEPARVGVHCPIDVDLERSLTRFDHRPPFLDQVGERDWFQTVDRLPLSGQGRGVFPELVHPLECFGSRLERFVVDLVPDQIDPAPGHVERIPRSCERISATVRRHSCWHLNIRSRSRCPEISRAMAMIQGAAASWRVFAWSSIGTRRPVRVIRKSGRQSGEPIEAKLSCLDRRSEGVPIGFCFVPRMDLLDGLTLEFSPRIAEEIRRGAVDLADRPVRYIDEEDRIGGPARVASRISSGPGPFWSPSRW
jgi:hypothetical protein